MTHDFSKQITRAKVPEKCDGPDMISFLAECSDAVLIQMAIAGRNDCFSLLMDRHLAVVKRRIRFMVSNEDDLEDVAQEIQLKAWRHLATFRLESNLRTWMTRIAINEACQLYRRGKRMLLREPLNEAIALREESPDQRLLRAEATAALHCAVAKLPRKYQEVVMLRDLCELGAEETAERLHSTVPAIKTRLFRARLMLSAALRKPESTRPASYALSNRVSKAEDLSPRRCAA